MCTSPRRWVAAGAAFSAAAALLGLGAPAARAAGAPTTPLTLKLVWSKDLPGVQLRASSPAPAHLDAAGPAMVVGGLDGKVYAYHLADGTTVPGWPVQLDKSVDSSPAVAPVDASGYDDVYVGSGTYDTGVGGGYWGIGHTGQVLLHRVGSDPNQAAEPVFSAPAVANLDCTSHPDVVAGALGQEEYALDGTNGSVLPGWPLFTYDTVFSSPAVADVAGRRLVFEGGDMTSIQGGVLRAINGAGRVVWTDQFDDVITSSPAVGDVTGTGRPALAVGAGFYFAKPGQATTASTKLFLIDPATGATEWSRDLGGYTRPSPAFGDLEGTGRADIVEATHGSPTDPNQGEIWAFDGAGNTLPGWPQATPPGVGAVIGGVATADLTGQGYDDVLVPTGDGLYIYDGRTGALAASVAVNKIGMQSTPLVTVDPNGALGITITGTNTTTNHGAIFHYQVTGGRIGPDSWPMFHHDPARTGSLAVPTGPAPGCSSQTARGYRFVASDGGVFDFGAASFHGSPVTAKVAGSAPPPRPSIVGMVATPDDAGYWLLGADGSVYSYGDAGFHGSAAGKGIHAVALAATPDGQGYWIVDNYGGVYTFGSARYFGSTGAIRLSSPIVGMAPTPNGNGYWLVGADGGIFSFGEARFYGSTGALHLSAPIVGMAATPDGNGYWFVASDGGVFSYGDAPFMGSTGGLHLSAPVVGMAAASDGHGYWLAAADGGVFSFGDAPFFGSTGGLRLAQPIVAMDP
jgi:hypothetical protein